MEIFDEYSNDQFVNILFLLSRLAIQIQYN